jgi:hypothetical protein
MRVDLSACDHPQIRAAGWDPGDPLATLGAVLAIGQLTAVCAGGPGCPCGPWADPSEYHWKLESVQALARPIVAMGRMGGLWEAPPSLVVNVRAMLLSPHRSREPRDGSRALTLSE